MESEEIEDEVEYFESSTNESVRNSWGMEIFGYIEMCYLFLFVAIGVPINLFTLARVGRQYHVTKSRILLLNVNLNISDLMILIFYAFVQAVWFITDRWYGGAVLCKLLRFFQLFSFCLSSNVIVCIGVDRLWSQLLAPVHVKSSANSRCRAMVCAAWIFALICSAPQLYVWDVYVWESGGYGQCVNTYGLVINSSLGEDFAAKAGNAAVLYDIYHLLITFWIPCVVVVVCYAVILKRVLKHLGDDSKVEFIQTNTCDCSSGASAIASPRLEFVGAARPQPRQKRQQFRREPQSERRTNVRAIGKSDCPKPNANPKRSILRQSAGEMRIRRTKYRTLKVTMAIVAAYIVCWLPYNFFALWIVLYPHSDIGIVINMLCGLIALNAIVNPLIYGRLTLALYWRGRRSRANFQGDARRFDGRVVRFT